MRRPARLERGCSPRALAGCKACVAIGADDQAVFDAEQAHERSGGYEVKRNRCPPTELDLVDDHVTTWSYGPVPGDEIRVKAGDTPSVEFDNRLPEATTIHWHGVALRNDMDGVHDLTQAPVAPGQHFTYRFTVPDPGTYWSHPHMGLQLDRGLYAPLIVEDPAEPLSYDVDHVLMIDDWVDGLQGATPESTLAGLQSMGVAGMDGMGGTMDGGTGMGTGGGMMAGSTSAALGGDAGDVAYRLHVINDRPTDRPSFNVPAGGVARLRIINAGSDTAYRFAVGGQRLLVTHADGFPVQPVEVDQLLLGMGERYDVLVKPASGAWPIVAVAEGKDGQATAVLRPSDA